MILTLFVLAVIGSTGILVDSKAAEPLRNLINKYGPAPLAYAINCWQCTGAWMGLFFGWLLFIDPTFAMLLTLTASGSAIGLFASATLNRIER